MSEPASRNAGGGDSVSLDAHLVVRRDGFELDAVLRAAAGEVVALLGPNGAGKTTALRALAGLVALDGGHIELDGERLDDPAGKRFVPPEHRHIGVVFQDYLLFPHLSALENVAFGPRCRGVPGPRPAPRPPTARPGRAGRARRQEAAAALRRAGPAGGPGPGPGDRAAAAAAGRAARRAGRADPARRPGPTCAVTSPGTPARPCWSPTTRWTR